MSRKKCYYTYPKMKPTGLYEQLHPPAPWWWRPLLVFLVGLAAWGGMSLAEADPLDQRDREYESYYSESYGGYTHYSGTTSDGDHVSGSTYEYAPGWTTQTEQVVTEEGSYDYHHCETFTYGSIQTINCY